ncbi:MAG: DUF2161 family putative PD-(D/E)XK-type phosphodiesterase [Clostridiales bacterium]|jgi:hypothetical protein|nr:DUF2161 family putative PD-(D/E)XK-type phosphodiesterase [Clostridiales bacterium]
MANKFYETDMYEPVKGFFQAMGYKVNGEVRGCDVTAVRYGETDGSLAELVVVEMKMSFCLQLIYQALDRLNVTAQVYMCVPRPAKINGAYKNMVRLVKRMGLGLLTVALDSPARCVEVILFPQEGKARDNKESRSLLKEIMGRALDSNTGGSTRRKLNTAFRERAIKILCVLEKTGPLSAGELIHRHGCPADSYLIMYRNYYGWFCRAGKGIFGLSEAGRQALEDPAFAELVAYYKSCLLQSTFGWESK